MVLPRRKFSENLVGLCQCHKRVRVPSIPWPPSCFGKRVSRKNRKMRMGTAQYSAPRPTADLRGYRSKIRQAGMRGNKSIASRRIVKQTEKARTINESRIKMLGLFFLSFDK